MNTRKIVITAAGLVAATVAFRRFGSPLGERVMKHCEMMFDRMPDHFPPKRMIRGIEEIEKQNDEILRQLQELLPAQLAARK